jgi:hypothetical protein
VGDGDILSLFLGRFFFKLRIKNPAEKGFSGA